MNDCGAPSCRHRDAEHLPSDRLPVEDLKFPRRTVEVETVESVRRELRGLVAALDVADWHLPVDHSRWGTCRSTGPDPSGVVVVDLS